MKVKKVYSKKLNTTINFKVEAKEDISTEDTDKKANWADNAKWLQYSYWINDGKWSRGDNWTNSSNWSQYGFWYDSESQWTQGWHNGTQWSQENSGGK